MAVKVSLGFRTNARKILELLDIIQSTHESRYYNGYLKMTNLLSRINQATNHSYGAGGSSSDPNVGMPSKITRKVSKIVE